MRYRAYHFLASSLLIAVLASVAFGQVTTRWFDINPNQSNNDANSPNGASGGRVNRVGAASDLSRVYAATEWGGLYTSFDQGNRWVKINTFAPQATWDVKVDPRNAGRVYATSFFDGRATNSQSGISISDDAGATWTAVNIPTLNTLNCVVAARRTQPSAWQIAIDPTNTRTVFVGTSCGLARSLDGGPWTFVDPSPFNPTSGTGDNAEQVYAVIAHGGQLVDVITDNGHFRSTSNGNAGTWTNIPTTGPRAGNTGPASTLAVSPRENYVLLAATGVNNIFESRDGGATWPTSISVPAGNAQGRIPFIKTNQLSNSNQFDVWYGDVSLFKTTATTPAPTTMGGPISRTPINAWTNMQTGAHNDVGDVMFDPRFSSGSCPRIFSTDGGMYLNIFANNPGCQVPIWEQPAVTPHATWIFGFDGIRLAPGVHAISYGLQDAGGFAAINVVEGHNPPMPAWNNYTCCDVGDNSEDSGTILSLEGSFSPGRAFRLFRRNQDGGGGGEIPNYPSAGTFNGFDSARGNVRFSPNGYLLNLSDAVYFTNNIAASPIGWTSLNKPNAINSGSGSLKVANLGGRPNAFYHTGNGLPNGPGNIFRSTLVGAAAGSTANWVPLTMPSGVNTATVFDVDPTNGNRIILAGINNATNNFEIWMTPNFGTDWNRLNQLETLMMGPGGNTFMNRPTQGPVEFGFGAYWQPSLLQFNPLDPSTIVAGAHDSGVFLSLNNGTNWQLISTPVNPTSNSQHIPRPIFAYFSPGRFNASTTAFDVWVGTRGAGVMKAVVER